MPPGPPVTASTAAPGRAAPRGEIDASDGTSFHFLRFSSDEGASCITGCASPSGVSATRFMPGDADAGTTPPVRSLRSSGSTSSIGVFRRLCRWNPRAPRTSSPPPRSATNARVIASCAPVSSSPSTFARTITSYPKSASRDAG